MRLAGAALATVCAVGALWLVGAAVAVAGSGSSANAAQGWSGAVTPSGYSVPRNVTLDLRAGETLESALERAGATADESRQAVLALGPDFDSASLPPGAVEAAIARPRLLWGTPRLIGLAVRTGPDSSLIVSRGFDGLLRLRPSEAEARTVTTVSSGVMQGSLYESAEHVGADLTLIAKLVKLFSHRLDFARDIHPGDHFALVFDRKVNDAGVTVETGDLLYAEMAARGRTMRFYAFSQGGQTQFFDEHGRSIKGLLLKTPVDGAHITSSFGMRDHPILGYTRMHQGIDFGADTGTPVLAAGDGVVVEARPWGGYGNWLRIRHAGGWETGYGHLSAYAAGLHPGDHVLQGQVVAYVGATGLATGPHLHYEVWRGGARVNPIGAAAGQGAYLQGDALSAFELQRARIDGLRLAASDSAPSDRPRLAALTAMRPRL